MLTEFQKVFSRIYASHEWNQGSSPGSHPLNTVQYRSLLQSFFYDSTIKTIVDLGCGDWQIMNLIDIPKNKQYIGLDVVDSVINENKKRYKAPNVNFTLTSGLLDDLPVGDLLVVKDVLQHWSLKHIELFINQVLPRYPKTLLTHSYKSYIPSCQANYNKDIPTGGYRPIDLADAPFDLSLKKLLDYVSTAGEIRVYLYESSQYPTRAEG
ncbi:MAG TPA: class I SAM-dependent methyltransferase [Opitutales bacterium]|nr:class I SAM-dependent methyltransferase [Opitutales bacterium]